MTQHPNILTQQHYDSLQEHEVGGLDKLQLTYNDIRPTIEALSAHPSIAPAVIGQSYFGTPIHRLTVGKGPVVILAWTQMHGDEPTATAAVLDLLALLSSTQPAGFPDNWQERITLHIIPMLNPDGAQHCTRHNGQGIDINRDAVAQQSPEGRLLWAQVQELNPDIAFNLHDQNPYYSAGETPNPATIAFLAPAYHQDKHVDGSRLRAKQLIAGMASVLRHWLPEHIGRYDDTYSHRSFGDNIAGTGASTILIESGAAFDDPHRQKARKMNGVALLHAMQLLMEARFDEYSLADYYAIADNVSDSMVDVKLHALKQQVAGGDAFTVDVAINCDRHTGKCQVEAIGDLSLQTGFTELKKDALALELAPIKGFEVAEPLTLDKSHYIALLRQGYHYFYGPAGMLTNDSGLPVWQRQTALPDKRSLMPDDPACFILSKKGTPVVAVLGKTFLSLE